MYAILTYFYLFCRLLLDEIFATIKHKLQRASIAKITSAETEKKKDNKMTNKNKEHYDVIIVGAGIGGIGSAFHLKDQSPGRTFVVLGINF